MMGLCGIRAAVLEEEDCEPGLEGEVPGLTELLVLEHRPRATRRLREQGSRLLAVIPTAAPSKSCVLVFRWHLWCSCHG